MVDETFRRPLFQVRPRTFNTIFLFTLFLAWQTFAQELVVSEYQVKGAMLYKFGQFTEWPPGSFVQPSQPISICVYGKDPFGSELDKALKNRSIHDRPIAIKRVIEVTELLTCSILFIGSQDQKVLKRVLDKVKNRPVLTVGEAESFTKLGGVIRIFHKDHSIHFEVNINAMKRSGLTISSKVLTLAKLYKEEP